MTSPGMVSPRALDTRFTNTPKKVTYEILYALNQFKAILLGVLKMKIPPIADNIDPKRQMYGSPSVRKVLNHTPNTTSPAETQQLILIPFLLISRLQGTAKRVCAMGKRSVLRDTSTMLRLKSLSTTELRDEKVLTGRELTRAVHTQIASMTKRYGCYFMTQSSIIMAFNYRICQYNIQRDNLFSHYDYHQATPSSYFSQRSLSRQKPIIHDGFRMYSFGICENVIMDAKLFCYQFSNPIEQIEMKWRPMDQGRKQSAFSLLAKSKSASILQTKQSKPSLAPTLTTISSIGSKKSAQQKENKSNEYFPQCSELPIQSKLFQHNSYSDYYPPPSQLSSKRVSFAEGESKLSLPTQLSFQTKRPSSILKNGSLTKKSRSKSNTSILNRSIEKEEKVCLPCDQANTSVLNKFKAILSDMENKSNKAKKGNIQDKFTDNMFPPVYSSVFTVQKTNAINKQQIGAQIVWKRIPMIFPGRKLILKKTVQQSSNLTIFSGKYSSQYFVQVLQAIKDCDLLLAEYFRDHIPNQFGVYCLRIFTENGWRRIIIDDFIPVVRVEGPKEEYIPAFTNIKSTVANPYRAKSLEIWPLLLEKAYASYYSTYEALKYGKKTDFLQEITGSMLLDNPIGHQQKHNAISIECDEEASNKNLSKQLQHKAIRFIKFRKSIMKLSKITPPKEISKKLRPDIFVRKIVIESNSDLSLMIRQKDQRFYHHSAVLYSYIWNRAVLLYKEYNGSYTWIDGKYSNRKSINFSISNAKSGEYFIIVMPQWKTIHRHQISLIVSSQKQPFQLQNQVYKEQEKMFEKGCSDLAERFGTLHQINKITCSYKFVHTQCGLIIDSVHNERISGEIVVQREWKPIEKGLIPFNMEFGAMNQRKKIEVLIEKNNQFSFVVMEINGRMHDLLKYSF